MMKATDRLAAKFGQSMAESLGHRSPEKIAAAAPKVIAMSDPNAGRRMARESAHIDLDRITPDPNQPRKVFTEESITQLAESLKTRGQLQPIRVRWNGELGKFVIISGERRYRAATRAELKTLACTVVEGELTETEIRIDQLVENLLREDLTPIDAAKSYEELMKLNGWTVERLADSLKITKGTVSKALAILKLPEDVQAHIEKGELSAASAYEVAKLPTPEAQREFVTRIMRDGLRRDEVVEAVGVLTGKRTAKEAGPDAEEKPKPNVTKKQFDVGNAKVVITWHKKTVRPKEVIAALEAALAEAKGPAEQPISEAS